MPSISESLLLERTNEPLNEVKYLDLRKSNIGCIKRDDLAACRRLETLILADNHIQSLDSLDCCPNIWSIDLTNNKLQNIDALSRFSAMGSLRLGGNQLDFNELRKLSHMHIISLNILNNSGLNIAGLSPQILRLGVLYICPWVWVLDGTLVTENDHSRSNSFFASMEGRKVAARAGFPTIQFKTTAVTNLRANCVFGHKTTEFFTSYPFDEGMKMHSGKGKTLGTDMEEWHLKHYRRHLLYNLNLAHSATVTISDMNQSRDIGDPSKVSLTSLNAQQMLFSIEIQQMGKNEKNTVSHKTTTKERKGHFVDQNILGTNSAIPLSLVDVSPELFKDLEAAGILKDACELHEEGLTVISGGRSVVEILDSGLDDVPHFKRNALLLLLVAWIRFSLPHALVVIAFQAIRYMGTSKSLYRNTDEPVKANTGKQHSDGVILSNNVKDAKLKTSSCVGVFALSNDIADRRVSLSILWGTAIIGWSKTIRNSELTSSEVNNQRIDFGGLYGPLIESLRECIPALLEPTASAPKRGSRTMTSPYNCSTPSSRISGAMSRLQSHIITTTSAEAQRPECSLVALEVGRFLCSLPCFHLFVNDAHVVKLLAAAADTSVRSMVECAVRERRSIMLRNKVFQEGESVPKEDTKYGIKQELMNSSVSSIADARLSFPIDVAVSLIGRTLNDWLLNSEASSRQSNIPLGGFWRDCNLPGFNGNSIMEKYEMTHPENAKLSTAEPIQRQNYGNTGDLVNLLHIKSHSAVRSLHKQQQVTAVSNDARNPDFRHLSQINNDEHGGSQTNVRIPQLGELVSINNGVQIMRIFSINIDMVLLEPVNSKISSDYVPYILLNLNGLYWDQTISHWRTTRYLTDDSIMMSSSLLYNNDEVNHGKPTHLPMSYNYKSTSVTTQGKDGDNSNRHRTYVMFDVENEDNRNAYSVTSAPFVASREDRHCHALAYHNHIEDLRNNACIREVGHSTKLASAVNYSPNVSLLSSPSTSEHHGRYSNRNAFIPSPTSMNAHKSSIASSKALITSPLMLESNSAELLSRPSSSKIPIESLRKNSNTPQQSHINNLKQQEPVMATELQEFVSLKNNNASTINTRPVSSSAGSGNESFISVKISQFSREGSPASSPCFNDEVMAHVEEPILFTTKPKPIASGNAPALFAEQVIQGAETSISKNNVGDFQLPSMVSSFRPYTTRTREDDTYTNLRSLPNQKCSLSMQKQREGIRTVCDVGRRKYHFTGKKLSEYSGSNHNDGRFCTRPLENIQYGIEGSAALRLSFFHPADVKPSTSAAADTTAATVAKCKYCNLQSQQQQQLNQYPPNPHALVRKQGMLQPHNRLLRPCSPSGILKQQVHHKEDSPSNRHRIKLHSSFRVSTVVGNEIPCKERILHRNLRHENRQYNFGGFVVNGRCRDCNFIKN